MSWEGGREGGKEVASEICRQMMGWVKRGRGRESYEGM